jgi:hypothetical protein
MTFQLRIDKTSFQFHIIFLGMNPITEPADRSRSHCHARPRAIGGIENLTASCGF